MFDFLRSSDSAAPVNSTPAELKNRLARGDRPTIVDVRTPEEYAGGHIPGARSIPLDRLSQELGSLNPDDEIVLVCRSGNRSLQAYRLLRSATASWHRWSHPVRLR